MKDVTLKTKAIQNVKKRYFIDALKALIGTIILTSVIGFVIYLAINAKEIKISNSIIPLLIVLFMGFMDYLLIKATFENFYYFFNPMKSDIFNT